MAKTNKYKLPKKPAYKKMPAAPVMPKGGIKTDAQLKAWEQKISVYQKKCSEIAKINKQKKTEYDKKVAEINKRKKADLKAKEDFKKKVQQLKTKLSSCKSSF